MNARRGMSWIVVLFVCGAVATAGADEPKKAKKQAPPVYPLAIFPFQERGVEVRTLGSKVTDLLFASLVVNPDLFLVDREDLKKTLDEQELNLSGAVNPDEATKVGQLTGAKILVTGSVFQVDKNMYVVAKIIGTETSRVVGASVKGSIRDELDGLVEDLAEAVSKNVVERADQLVAKPTTREDRLKSVQEQLGKAARPAVLIRIPENHISWPPAYQLQARVEGARTDVTVAVPGVPFVPGGAVRRHIDPAAETEFSLFCKESGFDVIDPKDGDKKQADILIEGECFSEYAARHGNLISTKARLEVKAIDRKTGQVIAIDRHTTVAVDLSENIAGKSALQEAAAILAERLLPKLVSQKKPAKGKNGKK